MSWEGHQSGRNSNGWHRCTHVTGYTTDGVGSENIKRIIVSEGELELGRKIANGTGHNTEDEGGSCVGK
jgi:hypothetical protein